MGIICGDGVGVDDWSIVRYLETGTTGPGIECSHNHKNSPALSRPFGLSVPAQRKQERQRERCQRVDTTVASEILQETEK